MDLHEKREVVMATREERNSKAAEEMKLGLEEKDKARREAEQAKLQDLNQGTEDPAARGASHHGIHWGPSYKTRRKAAKPTKGPKG
jgi:hypothetical protein